MTTRDRLARLARTAGFTAATVLAGCLSAFFLGAASRNLPHSDFAAFYSLGRQVLVYGPADVYVLRDQQAVFEAVGAKPFYPDMYPPLMSWLMAPLAVLPLPAAYVIWTVILLACLLLSAFLLIQGTHRRRLAYAIVGLTLVPVQLSLFHGQVVLLVAAGIAVAAWALPDRPILAAVAMTATLLKPQLAWLVPVALLAAGHHRACLAIAIAWLAVVIGSMAVIGPSGVSAYWNHLRLGIERPMDFGVIRELSLTGLLRGSPLEYVALAAIALAVAAASRRNRHLGPRLPIAAAILGSLLGTPFVHLQDLSILVVAAWLVFDGLGRLRDLALAGAWLVITVASTDFGPIAFTVAGIAIVVVAAAHGIYPRGTRAVPEPA